METRGDANVPRAPLDSKSTKHLQILHGSPFFRSYYQLGFDRNLRGEKR